MADGRSLNIILLEDDNESHPLLSSQVYSLATKLIVVFQIRAGVVGEMVVLLQFDPDMEQVNRAAIDAR